MGAGMIIFIVLLVALIGGGIYAYMKKWFWFQKSGGRKYTDVYSTTSGKKKGSFEKGACSDGGTGVSATAKKSSDCAAACDTAATTCNGYDWNETSTTPVCMLMPSIPTTATYTKGNKESCYALSK